MNLGAGNRRTDVGVLRLDDLDGDDGRELTGSAIAAIARALTGRTPVPTDLTPDRPRLMLDGACFVSLHRGSSLLGCIGSLQAHRPLHLDAAANGVAAAFSDPRLPAIDAEDFRAMSVEVSVLGTPVDLDTSSFDDLLARIRPGADGLIVRHGRRRATLLPSVWDKIADPGDFIDILWRKAGLPPRSWPARITVQRYRTVSFEDRGPRPPASPVN